MLAKFIPKNLLVSKVREAARANVPPRRKAAGGRDASGGGKAAWGTGAVTAGCVGLALLVAWAFAPAMANGFVDYDDQSYVTGNSVVQGGLNWAGVKWAIASTQLTSNWHPVTWLSHMLDCQMFGLEAWGHHLTSVLLHGLNTLLVFLVLRAATGSAGRSWWVAALFGLHPLRVESVAWVAERKDVLSACFGLLAVWAYVAFAKSKVQSLKSKVTEGRATQHVSRFYLLSLLCFALSLMSKPMLVTLPFALLLLDYWPLRRLSFRLLQHSNTPSLPPALPPLRLFLEKAPFFLLATASSVVTYLVQQRAGAMWASMPLWARAINAVVSYGRYVRKIFWPTDLCCFYPHPGLWPAWVVALASALCVGVSLATAWQRARSPYLLMGWLWFLGTLVPAAGLVQVGTQSMADRYSYWPSLGVLVMVVWGVGQLCARAPWRSVALGAAAAALVACGALTRAQTGFWREGETLFRQALAREGENARALNYLGTILDNKGASEEALACLRRAVALERGFSAAYYSLGLALMHLRRYEEAVPEFRATIQWQPGYADAHRGLGYALLRLDRATEALSAYQEALRLEPDSVETHNSLGAVLDRLERVDEAMAHYREALRLNPNSAQAHNNLGAALAKSGRPAEAAAEFAESLRLRPGVASAEINLANALAAAGQGTEAAGHFEEALRLTPNDAGARYYFGVLLAKMGRRGEAAEQFSQALRLRPTFPQAQAQLSALEATGPK